MINIESNKECCISLLKSTKRKGIENVITSLESMGFFEAPASSVNHLNEKGGLVQHSMNVYNLAKRFKAQILEEKPNLAESMPDDSIIIASLLHDVCKSQVYKPMTKKRKNALGFWEEYNGYDADYSDFPMGHGEKSVIMLLKLGMELTDSEMYAIRWHMSAWDLSFQSSEMKVSINAAKKNSPLVTLIQLADVAAAGIIEEFE